MEKINKKIKDEEKKFEHDIEEQSEKYEQEINHFCEDEISNIKIEGESFEEEIRKKALEIDKEYVENNKNSKK